MTPQNTPTTKPTTSPGGPKRRDTRTAAPRAHDEQRPPNPRPASGWLVSVGIAAAFAMAVWLVTAGVTNESETSASARADHSPTAAQQQLTDHEPQRFTNRAAADRRQVENLQKGQQRTDPSVDRDIRRFDNRAEADRRQVGNLLEAQQPTDPNGGASRP